MFGLVSGLVGGFTNKVKVGKELPNQGIKLSRKNSLAAFLVTWLLAGLLAGLIVGPILGLIVGLIAGLIVGLNRGGSAMTKHYALRLVLWLQGSTPFRLIQFLDHCSRLILVKKVGGGYIFIHRMLLDYFAELTPGAHAPCGESHAVGQKRESVAAFNSTEKSNENFIV